MHVLYVENGSPTTRYIMLTLIVFTGLVYFGICFVDWFLRKKYQHKASKNRLTPDLLDDIFRAMRQDGWRINLREDGTFVLYQEHWNVFVLWPWVIRKYLFGLSYDVTVCEAIYLHVTGKHPRRRNLRELCKQIGMNEHSFVELQSAGYNEGDFKYVRRQVFEHFKINDQPFVTSRL